MRLEVQKSRGDIYRMVRPTFDINTREDLCGVSAGGLA